MSEHIFDICIVGTGFGGLCAGIHLRSDGADVVLLEAAETIGGTWRDNTYPGAACDVQSHLYSLSFAPNPDWSRTYADGAEIQAYLEGVTDDHDLRSLIRFGCRVDRARWLEDGDCWLVETTRGPVRARMLVGAVGGLSQPYVPELPGLSTFAGPAFHTQRWRHDLSLDGLRVGVIGTGASAIQLIPEIAERARSVRVFQRTPPWILSKPDRRVGAVERWVYRRVPFALKARRWALYLHLEARVVAFVMQPRILRLYERQAARGLRRSVADPDLRKVLTPDYRLGCKRILLSNNYYDAVQRSNVHIDTQSIVGIVPEGVRTDVLHELDVLVLATGFAATAGLSFELHGREGTLSGAWSEGMSAYLGTAVAGFPNFFALVGPNTGLGHSSMVFMIESQVNYLRGAWQKLSSGSRVVEVRGEVQQAFNERLQERLQGTVWASGCRAWYSTLR